MPRYVRFGGQTDVILISLFSGTIAAACLTRLWFFPTVSAGGDAWAYVTYALGFREHGFLSELGSVRTYGYPAFLYLVSFLAPPSGRCNSGGALVDLGCLWLYAGVVQYVLFVAATLWLAKLLSEHSPRFARAVLVGLLLNPFLLSIVVDCLSEGLLASVIVLLTALSVCATRSTSIVRLLAPLAAGALTSCFALMIRPAAIPVVMAWAIASFAALWSNPRLAMDRLSTQQTIPPSRFPPRPRIAALNLALLLAACSITWMPQVYYNWVTWGQISFLPVCRLDQIQASLSVPVLRYESVVPGEIVEPFFYLSPFSTNDVVKGHPTNWYMDHPIAAVATVLLRIVAGLSINHLFTYVYPGQALLEVALMAGYWGLICLGIMRIAKLSGAGWSMLPSCFRAAVVFVTACTVSILALNSFTAVQLRFNLMPIGVLSVFGVDALLGTDGMVARARSIFLATVAACILTACCVLFLSSYGTAGPILNAPTVTGLKCYTFSSEAPEGGSHAPLQ
jgi:hypothetical protein